jgi:hypothetical protein
LLLSSVPIWGQNCITEAALLLRSISDFDFPTLSAYSRTPSPLPSACSLSFRSRNRDKRLGGVAVTASSVEPTIQSKNTTSSASAFRAQSRFKDLRSSPQRFARGYRAWRQAGGRIVRQDAAGPFSCWFSGPEPRSRFQQGRRQGERQYEFDLALLVHPTHSHPRSPTAKGSEWFRSLK